MTPEMLTHLGCYIAREYGDRYYVERLDLGTAPLFATVAHVVCSGDGSRFSLRITATAGCRYECSDIVEVPATCKTCRVAPATLPAYSPSPDLCAKCSAAAWARLDAKAATTPGTPANESTNVWD